MCLRIAYLALRSYSANGISRVDEHSAYSHQRLPVQPTRRCNGDDSVRGFGVGLLPPTVDTQKGAGASATVAISSSMKLLLPPPLEEREEERFAGESVLL